MPTSRLITPPDALITSNRGGTYAATYRVEDSGNKIVAGLAAIILGQSSGPDTIPPYGSAFNLTIIGTPVQDLGSFLLDMRARAVGSPLPDPGVKVDAWDVDVTWRAPDQGEYPGESGIQALSRQPRYWVEFESRQERITQARNVQALRAGSPVAAGNRLAQRAANTLGIIEDAAGTPQADRFIDDIAPVLVIQQNVSSYNTAVALNLNFRKTRNSATWKGIPAGQARFIRAETGQPLRDGTTGTEYFEMQTRVEFLADPHYITIPNVGFDYVQRLPVTGPPYTSLALRHAADEDGLPLSDPVTLDYGGLRQTTAGEWKIDYDYLTAKDYSGIA